VEILIDFKWRYKMTYKPVPKKPYKPVPTKPYTPVPLKDYTQVPLKDYTTKPLKPYTPVPLKDYTPAPLKPYKPIPLKPYTPAPIKPYRPVQTWIRKGLKEGKAIDREPIEGKVWEYCPECGEIVSLDLDGKTMVCRNCKNKVRYIPD